MSHRLKDSSSPYLLQHAENPVDWYPWGDEAWEAARRQDLPVLVSIGYSTCHWCHVMAHQVFEHRDTARLMNQKLVCIKVDREEHPDVDEVYMEACQTLTGGGGWPLNVLCDNKGRPFWAGTYVPRDRWERLIWEVSRLWQAEREKIFQTVAQLEGFLQKSPPVTQGEPLLVVDWEKPLKASYDVVDPCFSGQGTAPRFPQSQLYSFLVSRKTVSDPFPYGLWNVLETLQDSGLHDRVGGGFHRYSVERSWRIPHFEKMLYDNAQLLGAFALAGARFQRPDFLRTAQRTAEYLLRDLSVESSEGLWLGFGTGEDADDPGGEGAFYAWTPAQLEEILGAETGRLLAQEWDLIPPESVAEVDHHGGFGQEPRPWLIPHPRSSAVFAGSEPLKREEARKRWDSVYPKLREARGQRPRPAKDNKVLTDWNGLALEGFALLYAQDPDPRWAETCQNLVEVLKSRMRPHPSAPGGRILRWRDLDGYSTDYGHGALGLVTAGEIFNQPAWLELALQWVEWGWGLLGEEDGRIYSTPADRKLFMRSQERLDNAYPAGAHSLLLAAVRLQHSGLLNWTPTRWQGIWNQRSGVLEKYPLAVPTLLKAWTEFNEGPMNLSFPPGPPEDEAVWRRWGGTQIRVKKAVGPAQFCEKDQCLLTPQNPLKYLECSGFFFPPD